MLPSTEEQVDPSRTGKSTGNEVARFNKLSKGPSVCSFSGSKGNAAKCSGRQTAPSAGAATCQVGLSSFGFGGTNAHAVLTVQKPRRIIHIVVSLDEFG